MIFIIYMAAGNSRRFGSNKLLYYVEGKPMYRHGLDRVLSVIEGREDCACLVISQYEEILQYAKIHGAVSVASPESVLGVSYTIENALKAIERFEQIDHIGAEHSYFVFMTADQPYVSEKTIKKVLDNVAVMEAKGYETASVYCGDTPGNPTVFSASMMPELYALSGDEGGRKVIRKHRCLRIEVEDGREMEDIDRLDK